MDSVPPLVAIVGKPNSGKSTLFNRITGSRKAITHSSPGVTRDVQYHDVEWEEVSLRIADTGGFSLGEHDHLQHLVSDRVMRCVKEADLVLLLMDVRTGPTAEDQELIENLRRYMPKTLAVVNKVERGEDRLNVHEFYGFGFPEVMAISAVHGTGVSELMERVIERIPRVRCELEEPAMKISIVGRPNVGKSSLINKLAGDEYHIVSETPYTTRDSLDIRIRYQDREVLLVDTAGLKRRSRTVKALEKISSLKSLDSIHRSDIVLFLLDISISISRQDARIASEAHRCGRGIAVLINKWDILQKDDRTYDEIVKTVRNRFPFLPYAPILSISAKTGLRTDKILPLCFDIQKHRSRWIQTSTINSFMEDITRRNPPPLTGGTRGKIFYATQTGVSPPTFTLFVNKPSYFHRTYLRYITNQLRKVFTFMGTNIRIFLKSRNR